MKLNKRIRNGLIGLLTALTITGTATDLPFGIRLFNNLENRTFVGALINYNQKVNKF